MVQQTADMSDLDAEMDKRTYQPVDTAPANHDIDAALETVRQFRNSGLNRPTVKQLSEELAVKAGVRRNSTKNKLYSAAKYGLIGFEPNPRTNLNEVVLLPLGIAALEPETERQAKIRAFLHVPVNRAVATRYQDGPFPPSEELERFMREDLRMSPSQISTARQIIVRSAEKIGLLDEGHERLMIPPDVILPPNAFMLETPNEVSQEGEDGMVQLESPVTDSRGHVDEIVAASITPTLGTPANMPNMPQVPVGGPNQPPIPSPSIIEWWWQKKPRTGDPEAKWLRWHKTLGDILILEFDEERTR